MENEININQRTEGERKAFTEGFRNATNLIDQYWKRGDNIGDIINRLKLLHGSMVKSQATLKKAVCDGN